MFESIIRKMLREAREFSPEDFLKRLQSVVTLANRPGTQGENQAAMAALDRMKETASNERIRMSKSDGEYFLSRVRNIINNIGKEEPSTTRREPPKQDTHPPAYKIGSWVFNTKLYVAGKVTAIFYNRLVREWFVRVEVPSDNRVLPEWRAATHLRKATQEEVDAALAKKAAADSTPEFKVGDWVYFCSFNWHQNSSNPVGRLGIIVEIIKGIDHVILKVKYLDERTQTFSKPMEDTAKHFRKATQEEVDSVWKGNKKEDKSSSYSSWRIYGFARCQDGTSNKVYGYASNGKTWVTFWGRYDGPYAIKVYSTQSEARGVFDKKVREKYDVAPETSDAMDLLKAALKKNGVT